MVRESQKFTPWLQSRWCRTFLVPTLFVLLSGLPLVACLFVPGSSREYLFNLDYAVMMVLAAIGMAMLRARKVVTVVLFVGLIFVSGSDLFDALSKPFNAGIYGPSEYITAYAAWPWDQIIPWTIGLIVLCAAVVLVMRRVPAKPQVLPMVISTIALIGVDIVSGNTHLFWRPGSVIPNLISSSTLRLIQGEMWTNGIRSIEPAPGESLYTSVGTNKIPPDSILSVAVESLGAYADGRQDAFSRSLIAGLGGAYEVAGVRRHLTEGKTIHGELRELCGLRIAGTPNSFSDLGQLGDCLPAMLARRGYRTVGVHGNVAEFYHRDAIYQEVGLKRTYFRNDFDPHLPRCDTLMFKGICDRDVYALALRQFPAKGRAFVHVMTMDTHFPLTADTGDRCMTMSMDPICLYESRFSKSGRELAAAVRGATRKPDTIFIYGDHPPPAWHPQADRQFLVGQVPFVELRRVRR